mgnify:CR=1 FL=1
MTSIEIWAIGIVAAVITGILGFLLGRRQPVGSPEQMKQLLQIWLGYKVSHGIRS